MTARPVSPPPVRLELFPRPLGATSRTALLLALALSFVVPFVLPPLVRRAILARQRRLPENAVARASDAIDAGDLRLAQQEVGRVLRFVPERDASGRIAVVRWSSLEESAFVPSLLDLARKLRTRGLAREARLVAWQAIRREHLFRRALEEPAAWEILAADAAGRDSARLVSFVSLLAARGAPSALRSLERIGGPTGRIDPATAALVRLVEARANGPSATIAPLDDRSLAAASDAELALAAGRIEVDAAIESGNRAAAIGRARSLLARFPERLDARALVALAGTGTSADDFLRAEPGAGDLRIEPRELAPIETPFRDRRPLSTSEPGRVAMNEATVAESRLLLPAGAVSLWIVASGSEALGIRPILLVSRGDDEPFPLVVASSRPLLYRVPIPAGMPAPLRIEFLNDFEIPLEGALHDRNAFLGPMRVDAAPEPAR